MYYLKFNLMVLVLALVLVGCAKEELSTEAQKADAVASELALPTIAVDSEAAVAEMARLSAANNERLSQLALPRSCMETVTVPDDAATIQEAVDLACDYGDVIVKAGDYEEVVFVSKPGLHIKANGEVHLIGGFNLDDAADETTIQKFNIQIGTENFHGVNALNVTGGQIKQNTITGPGGTAIRYVNGNDVKIQDNTVSDINWGIFFGTSLPDGASHNNTILKNSISGITFASVIGLEGNCDNNLISGNILMDNPIRFNAGVMFYSFIATNVPARTCDNNVVKNNTIHNSTTGIWIYADGHNNTIGPNNDVTENIAYGFYIDGLSSGSNIFNNEFLANEPCDIGNYAIDPLANTFTNNEYDCLEEL